MKGVVLAGGEGRRLQPLTANRPKPMLPVAGRPCIDFVLRSLVRADITDLVIMAGPHTEAVRTAFGAGGSIGASISFGEEPTPAGTAGSVKLVAAEFDTTFVVAMGDVFADLDVRALVDFHRERGAAATIALTEVENPTEFGIAVLDSRGRIERFQEKPRAEEAFSKLANAGVYVLEPQALALVPPATKFDFSKDLFPLILSKGLPLFGRLLEGSWVDIGRPADLLRANLESVRRGGGDHEAPHGVFGPAIVGSAYAVDEGARLIGPLYLGDDVAIGSNALVESSALYGAVSVGSGARVQGSMILGGSRIGDDCEVTDSVLGEDCVLEPGARLHGSVVGDHAIIHGNDPAGRHGTA